MVAFKVWCGFFLWLSNLCCLFQYLFHPPKIEQLSKKNVRKQWNYSIPGNMGVQRSLFCSACTLWNSIHNFLSIKRSFSKMCMSSLVGLHLMHASLSVEFFFSILNNIGSVGHSMVLTTSRFWVWSRVGPFTAELDLMNLVGPFQHTVFCDSVIQ